jgi:hypothetical protein
VFFVRGMLGLFRNDGGGVFTWRRSMTRRRSRRCWGHWGCVERNRGRLGAGRRRVAKAGDRTATPAGRSDGEGRCGGSVGAAAGERCIRWAENWSEGAEFGPSRGLTGGAWAALRWGLAGLGGPGLQLVSPTRRKRGC